MPRPERTSVRGPVVSIRGVGAYFPPTELSTDELIRAERPGTLFGKKLQELIGCRSIRAAGPSDSSSGLAVLAARGALESAGLSASGLDAVVSVGCVMPDVDVWSTPAKIAKELGATPRECFGIGDAACAGSYAAVRALLPLMTAPRGPERVLLAAGAVMPGGRFFPPATVFGDGAGAWVLERHDPARRVPRFAIVAAELRSFPEHVDAFGPMAGMNILRAEGRLEPRWWTFGIRDHAAFTQLRRVNFDLGAETILETLDHVGWDPSSLTWLVPDNVTFRVGEELSMRIGLPFDRVFKEGCERFGHAFSADMFANLARLLESREVRTGDRIGLVGMGIGQHWGVVLIEV